MYRVSRLDFLFIALTLVLLLWLSGVVDTTLGERDGRRDALENLHDGRLVLKKAGLRRGWDNEYDRLLQIRYGIATEPFAGCVLDTYKSAYLSAYNNEMTPAIQAKNGDVPFDALLDEARRTHEARQEVEWKSQVDAISKQP